VTTPPNGSLLPSELDFLGSKALQIDVIVKMHVSVWKL